MAREVTCPPCGEVIRAEDDAELIEKVQRHAREQHNTELSEDEILAEARDV